MKIRKSKEEDICLCDHEEQNNLPKTRYCIFVCPTKVKEMFAKMRQSAVEAKKKKDEN